MRKCRFGISCKFRHVRKGRCLRAHNSLEMGLCKYEKNCKSIRCPYWHDLSFIYTMFIPVCGYKERCFNKYCRGIHPQETRMAYMVRFYGWEFPIKKYISVQLYTDKRKKYTFPTSIQKSWYNSNILEPKLVGIILGYL